MSSLTGSTISSTYQSLLKIDGNNTLSATLRNITDGVGNTTPLSMSTTLLNISTAFKLSSYGTGTRTGTATYNLAVDATGNVIEIAGGGGGTTINPNNNVIPVRLNATTFIDSNIENDANNYLKTSVTPTSGDYFGLFIDFGNLISSLGDINFNNGCKLQINNAQSLISSYYLNNPYGIVLDFNNNDFLLGTFDYGFYVVNGGASFYMGDYGGISTKDYLLIDNTNNFLATYSNNNQIGLKLDFATDLYSFADFNSVSSGTSFYIDVANSQMYTKHSGQQEGLFFDFVNDYFQIGDFASTNNGTYLKIDDDNALIRTYFAGHGNGIQFDFGNKKYCFGDYDNQNNGTSILIDDASENITFNANKKLVFQGTNLQDNNPRTYSDKNLVVQAPNGSTYYIPLYN
jgi:hypothetical protein